MPGIIAGSMQVFIPSLGSFVTAAILGGGKSQMTGNLIQLQFGQSRSRAFGATISVVVLALMMLVLMRIAWWKIAAGAQDMNLRRLPLTREISLAVPVCLYMPVVVLIVYSFNANRTATVCSETPPPWGSNPAAVARARSRRC